jgi:hypothetical protein
LMGLVRLRRCRRLHHDLDRMRCKRIQIAEWTAYCDCNPAPRRPPQRRGKKRMKFNNLPLNQ